MKTVQFDPNIEIIPPRKFKSKFKSKFKFIFCKIM